MTCPACGYQLVDGADECPRCGIIVAKWRARQEAEGTRRAAEGAREAELRSVGVETPIRSTSAKVSLRGRTAFFKQMSSLLQSGLPIQEALGIAGGIAAPVAVRRACGRVRADVARGETFGSAIDAARFLDREAVVLLSAAERIGNLPVAFAELAGEAETEAAFRRARILGLTYPAILVVLAIFALPLKVLVFEGPLRYFAETLPTFGGVVGAVVFVSMILPRILGRLGAPSGLRDAACAIPVLGRPWRAMRVARFARSLGRFLEAGVEMGEALQSAARSTGQRRFMRGIDAAAQHLAAGETLAMALGSTGLFAADFDLAVDGGERSGKLAPTLVGMARSYEEAALHQIRVTILVGTTFAAIAVMGLIGYRLFTEMQGTVKGVQGAIDSVLNEAGGLQRGVEKSFEQLDKLLDQ